MQKLHIAVRSLLEKISMEYPAIKPPISRGLYLADRAKTEMHDVTFAKTLKNEFATLALRIQLELDGHDGGVNHKKLYSLLLVSLVMTISMYDANKNEKQKMRGLDNLYDDYLDLLYLDRFGADSENDPAAIVLDRKQKLKEESKALMVDTPFIAEVTSL